MGALYQEVWQQKQIDARRCRQCGRATGVKYRHCWRCRAKARKWQAARRSRIKAS